MFTIFDEHQHMAKRPPGNAAPPPKVEQDDDLAPVMLTKAEFGQRLRRLMLRRGWTQSELARRANLARDSISTYIRGAVFPSEHSLVALAKALGVTAEQLLPNYAENSIRKTVATSFEMRASPTEPGMMWLKIDQAVSLSAAVKIAAILEEDQPFAARRAAN